MAADDVAPGVERLMTIKYMLVCVFPKDGFQLPVPIWCGGMM